MATDRIAILSRNPADGRLTLLKINDVPLPAYQPGYFRIPASTTSRSRRRRLPCRAGAARLRRRRERPHGVGEHDGEQQVRGLRFRRDGRDHRHADRERLSRRSGCGRPHHRPGRERDGNLLYGATQFNGGEKGNIYILSRNTDGTWSQQAGSPIDLFNDTYFQTYTPTSSQRDSRYIYGLTASPDGQQLYVQTAHARQDPVFQFVYGSQLAVTAYTINQSTGALSYLDRDTVAIRQDDWFRFEIANGELGFSPDGRSAFALERTLDFFDFSDNPVRAFTRVADPASADFGKLTVAGSFTLDRFPETSVTITNDQLILGTLVRNLDGSLYLTGKRLYSHDGSGSVSNAIDLVNGEPQVRPVSSFSAATAIGNLVYAVSADSDALVTYDGTSLNVVDTQIGPWNRFLDNVSSVDVSAEGTSVYVTSPTDGSVSRFAVPNALDGKPVYATQRPGSGGTASSVPSTPMERYTSPATRMARSASSTPA